MATHRAFVCSDVVKEIASYLPTADVISLVKCGCKTLNKLLRIHINYCLVITRRDMERVYPYLTIFKYIKYVYIKSRYNIECQLEHAERLVAPYLSVRNSKFGPNLKCIIARSIINCEFAVPPEECVELDTYSCSPNTTRAGGIGVLKVLEHTDDECKILYPRLKEIDTRWCCFVGKPLQSTKINYRCNRSYNITNGMCSLCGKRTYTAIMYDTQLDKSLSMCDGIAYILMNGYYPQYLRV